MATMDGLVSGATADADEVVCLPGLVGESAKAKLLPTKNTTKPIANHVHEFEFFLTMIISILRLRPLGAFGDDDGWAFHGPKNRDEIF